MVTVRQITRPGDRLRTFRVLVAAALPVRRLQHIDDRGEEMFNVTPRRPFPIHRPVDRRMGWELADEDAEAAPVERYSGDELSEGESVEPLEVGFDCLPVLFEEREEAETSPGVVT